MSGNKANKSGNNFETYRQVAPETVDDQRLRDIIKNNGNDHNAILLAIENIWHDTPDQKAVGSEWVTTAKSNKKDVAPVKGSANSSGRRNESGSGRGSAGRGRSLPASGGRGGGDSRGDRGAQRSAAPRATGDRNSPSAASPTPAAEEQDVEEVVEEAPAVVAAPVAAAPVAAPLPVSSGASWGAGPSLAERLKRAEADKLRAEQQAKETPVVAVAAVAATSAAAASSADAAASENQKRTRARRARGGSASGKDASGKRADDEVSGDLAEAAESLTLESAAEVAVVAEVPPPPPLVQVVSTAAPSAVEAALAVSSSSDMGVASSQGFLNMGKWEAPVEAAEMSAFQFGSFGNAYGEDDSVNGGVSASQVGTNPAAAPWTGLHTEEKVVSNVWGTGADQSLDMSGGLFAQQNSAASKALESSPDAGNVAATRAPPGLGQKANANASNNASRSTVGQIKNNKNDINTAQNQTQQTQLPSYQQQQQSYNQALPPGMNNRNAPALNPLAGALPYPYNPSFDLAQQAQFSGYPLGGLVPPVAPATTAASSAAPASTSSAAASSTAAPAAGVAQQQQAYPAAPFPFYPNPYYPSQAYYYGQPQMPNYYGQGRDMYQQRGNPYGGNPYGNTGSLYPGDVYGQQAAGQFPDAAGNYGGVHPGMQGAGNAAANAGSSAGNNNNKAAKNANPAGAVGAGAAPGMTPDQHTANLLMNSGYGYNPYNARGPMDAQWQGYPGNQAGGWGAPMMFPNNASPTNLGGSAQQQGQTQQQQQQQQGGNRGAANNNGYGNNNSFGGRGNGAGAAPSAGGVSGQGNW